MILQQNLIINNKATESKMNEHEIIFSHTVVYASATHSTGVRHELRLPR